MYRIDRPKEPFGIASQTSLIAGALIEEKIPVYSRLLLQSPFTEPECVLSSEIFPGQSLLQQKCIKTLQRLVQDTASVHSGELIEIALTQMQPVLQMLPQKTFCTGLHPADPADDHIAVKGRRDPALQNLRLIAAKSSFSKTEDRLAHIFIRHDLRTGIKAVQKGKIL